ncbi:MAG: hypothetical protein DYH12_24840, partial [Sorangiineae bacterium PRO1]|nr:hypothetical protein [Sorangiineae bacterium PRO1]
MIGSRPLAAATFVLCLASGSRADPGLAEAEWQPGSSNVEPASEAAPEPRDESSLDPARRALDTAVAVG